MSQTECLFENEIVKKVSLRYLLYLPKDYGKNPHAKWPMILFLHGMGERGNNLELVKKHGIPKIVEKKEDFPFVVISPQCPITSMWNMMLDELHALLVDAVQRYNADENRVYLTGLSMGGYGAWHLAAAYPDLFAAVVPICGGMIHDKDVSEQIKGLKDVPIWIFHGAKDEVVSVENSKELYEALKKLGGKVKLTIYPDLGHDSWTVTYDNPNLYKWLLKQKKQTKRSPR
ncbi:alpha/beta hydrolase [Candidatus Bathyarchaeota archaeon]|nr:alpha/beta hydrolase [Candidatus Bathyarchaeota archaeon]